MKHFKYKTCLLLGQIYNKLEKKHCSPYKYGSYHSVDDAKAACSVDANCQAIYDQACGGVWDGYGSADVYLCSIGSSYASSSSSCIYEKLGISYY